MCIQRSTHTCTCQSVHTCIKTRTHLHCAILLFSGRKSLYVHVCTLSCVCVCVYIHIHMNYGRHFSFLEGSLNICTWYTLLCVCVCVYTCTNALWATFGGTTRHMHVCTLSRVCVYIFTCEHAPRATFELSGGRT